MGKHSPFVISGLSPFYCLVKLFSALIVNTSLHTFERKKSGVILYGKTQRLAQQFLVSSNII